MFEKFWWLILGALIGWFLQQYRVARSEDVALINEHIKDVEKFSDAAQAYWLKKPADKEEDLALAAKVRATHSATTLLYPDILTLCERQGLVYKALTFDLFTTATGGDFEGRDRKLDVSRAIDVGDRAAQLVHLLRLHRTYVISMKRLWRSLINRGRIKLDRYSGSKSQF